MREFYIMFKAETNDWHIVYDSVTEAKTVSTFSSRALAEKWCAKMNKSERKNND